MWGWFKGFFLRRKLRKAREAITRLCAESVSPACAFGGGKSAVVLLHLLHEVGGQKYPCRVIRLTTASAIPELDDLTAEVGRRWHLEILTLELGGLFPEQTTETGAQDFDRCCRQLRVDGLARAAQLYKFDTVFTGRRADDPDFHAINDARARLGEDALRWADPLHAFDQAEIDWVIRTYHLPVCALYDDSVTQVSCLPCARPNSLS